MSADIFVSFLEYTALVLAHKGNAAFFGCHPETPETSCRGRKRKESCWEAAFRRISDIEIIWKTGRELKSYAVAGLRSHNTVSRKPQMRHRWKQFSYFECRNLAFCRNTLPLFCTTNCWFRSVPEYTFFCISNRFLKYPNKASPVGA